MAAPILAICYTEDQPGGARIQEIADRLSGAGVRLAGVVQLPPQNEEKDEEAACDIIVEVLPTGTKMCISERRGKFATACKLDSGALEMVSALAEAQLENAPELMILSKFAKREAEGHGLRQVIGRALEADVPVLIGLPAEYRGTFEAFAGEFAEIAESQRAAEGWLAERFGV